MTPVDAEYLALDPLRRDEALLGIQGPDTREIWRLIVDGLAELQESSWSRAWPGGLLGEACSRHADGTPCTHSVAEVLGLDWERRAPLPESMTRLIGGGLLYAIHPLTCEAKSGLYSRATGIVLRTFVGPPRTSRRPRSEYECLRQRATRVLETLGGLVGIPANSRTRARRGSIEVLVRLCTRSLLDRTAHARGHRPPLRGATEWFDVPPFSW